MAIVNRFPLFQKSGFPQNCNVFAGVNPFTIGLEAEASETWIALQARDEDDAVIFETKPRPFFNDAVQFDIAPLLQSGLYIEDWSSNARAQGAYGVASRLIFTLWQKTNIITTFTEIATFGGAIDVPFLAVVAANQLGHQYGNTLADYCPYVDGVVEVKGRFLTRFEDIQLFWYSSKATPTTAADVMVLYPALLLPLFDDTAQRTAITRNYITELDDTLITSTTSTPTEQLAYVTIPNAETWVFDNEAVLLQVGQGTNPTAPTTSEILAFIKLVPRRVCRNPYAIKWLNSLGGFEVWVFDVARSPSVLESNGDTFGISVDDVATATATAGTYAKDSFTTLSLFADQLTLVQARALNEIIYSPLVMLYVGEYANGATADKWHGIVVETGKAAPIDTYDPVHRFELEIRLPTTYHPNN